MNKQFYHPFSGAFLANERQGYGFIATQKYDLARHKFQKMIELAPRDRRGHAGLAFVAECEWAWLEAIKCWANCIAIGSGPDIQAIARTADCLVEVGRIEEARDLFESIPEQYDGLAGQARIATMQSTALVAGLRWDECMLQFPDEIRGFLGKASLLLQRESYEEADELLCHAVSIWPESLDARELWARCATAARNWEEADRRWNALLQKRSDHREIPVGYARHVAAVADESVVHSFLALLADRPIAIAEFLFDYNMACEEYDLAIAQAAKLVALEDQVPWRRITYASALMRQGSPDSRKLAVEVLTELHSKAHDSILVKARLIDAYIRSNLEQPAKELLATIPAEEKRSEIEVLRAWRVHQDSGIDPAKQSWSAILERQYFPAVHAPISDLSRVDGNDISIRQDEVILVTAIRNERWRLNWFLEYYRSLGIDKFIFVDNASTDNSATLLLNSSDVILYRSSESYSRSGAGMRWINHLIEQHGRSNWCIFVDVDEAFVYPDYENYNVHVLADYLNRAGYEAMQACMLDMYPKSIASVGAKPWSLEHKFFDTNFHCYNNSICPYSEIYGGVRRRLFRGYQVMQKVPLINGAAGIKFLTSSHQITPAKLADTKGALLHYHLVSMFDPKLRSLVQDEIDRREHSGYAVERRRLLSLISETDAHESMLEQFSSRYRSSKQLVELGIIQAGSLYRQN